MEAGEAEADIQSRPNPITNHVIGEKLFNLFSPKELKSIRLVCNEWKDASLSTWRSKARLLILDGSQGDDPREDRGVTLQQLLSLSEEGPAGEEKYALVSKPFRKVYIRKWQHHPSDHLGEDPEKNLKTEFWRRFGGSIKSLQMYFCGFQDVQTLQNIITRDTPKLEELELFQNQISQAGIPGFWKSEQEEGAGPVISEKLKYLDIDGDLDLDWSFICSSFPNLKTVVLSGCQAFDKPLTELLTNIIARRKDDNTKLAIKKLDIEDLQRPYIPSISLEIVKLFQDAKLPLQTFLVDLGGSTEESVVHRLLQTHVTTLRGLTCHRCFSAQPFKSLTTGLPFKLLTDLRLLGPITNNFNFLKDTPNLEILHVFHISDYHYKLTNREENGHHQVFTLESTPHFLGGLCLPHLKELQGDFRIDDKDSFVRLTKWFPNLVHLNVPLNKDTFPVVCTAWRDSLRELELQSDSQINDVVLTGISPWEIYDDDEDDDSDDEAVPREPNITLLKKLETFRVCLPRRMFHYPCLHRIPTFGDHGILKGFSSLENLNCLKIYIKRQLMETTMEKLKGISSLRILEVEDCGCD